MGNNNPKQSSLIMAFNRDQWQYKDKLNYCYLLHNSTLNMNAQEYQIPSSDLEKQLSMYEARQPGNPLSEHLVWVYFISNLYLTYIPLKIDHVHILTERIPWRLHNLFNNLDFYESLSVLKDVYLGYNSLTTYYGPVAPTDKCIGFNEKGKTKVWVNQVFSQNNPNIQSKFSNYSYQEKMQNYVAIIFNMVQSKTINPSSELRLMFQNSNPNYIQAVNIIDRLISRDNIPVPLTINIQKQLQPMKNNIARPINSNIQANQNILTNPSKVQSPQIGLNYLPKSQSPQIILNNPQIPFNNQYNPIIVRQTIQTPLRVNSPTQIRKKQQSNIDNQIIRQKLRRIGSQGQLNIVNEQNIGRQTILSNHRKSENIAIKAISNQYLIGTRRPTFTHSQHQFNRVQINILKQNPNPMVGVPNPPFFKSFSNISRNSMQTQRNKQLQASTRSQTKKNSEVKIQQMVKVQINKQPQNNSTKQQHNLAQSSPMLLNLPDQIKQQKQYKVEGGEIRKITKFIQTQREQGRDSIQNTIKIQQEKTIKKKHLQIKQKIQPSQSEQEIPIQSRISFKSSNSSLLPYKRTPGKIIKISHQKINDQQIEDYMKQRQSLEINTNTNQANQISNSKIQQYSQLIEGKYQQLTKKQRNSHEYCQNIYKQEQQKYNRQVEQQNDERHEISHRQIDIDVRELERHLDKKFKHTIEQKDVIEENQSDEELSIDKLDRKLIKFQQKSVKSTVRENNPYEFEKMKFSSQVNQKQQRQHQIFAPIAKIQKLQNEYSKNKLTKHKKAISFIDLKYQKYITKLDKQKSPNKIEKTYQIKEEHIQRDSSSQKSKRGHQKYKSHLKVTGPQKTISYDDLRSFLWK